jgi:CBS domain-containing protein
MQVSECMTREVQTVPPDAPIRDAAQCMAKEDVGILPVRENDRLVGLITDRDIAIRAVGAGRDPSTPVREVMSAEVKYCFADEDVDDVLENMGDIQVRRLPVVDRDKRLVGIVSLSDLAQEETEETGKALSDIARPSAQHSQRVTEPAQ